MVVTCKRQCFDGQRCIRYYPGDQDDIDPLSPIAMYFSFPSGTRVYCKKRGVEGTEISIGQDKIPNRSGVLT